jgi:hypothetical protein
LDGEAIDDEPPARNNYNRKKRALDDVSNGSKEPASNKKRGCKPKDKDSSSNKADDSSDAQPKPSQGKSSKASKTDSSSNNNESDSKKASSKKGGRKPKDKDSSSNKAASSDASQPSIFTSEDPVLDAEPRLQQKVIASENQTRAEPKAPPKLNKKATEEKKSSAKKAGKPQDSSRRGGDDRCIARIRVAQENGKYGPPTDIWLSELKAIKDGIQEYSIQMKRGGHLRFIGGMVSPEQCKDVAKEMETIEYRRYPLKGLNALEPRVHLLLSKAANPPANKPKEKKSMDFHGNLEEDLNYVDGEYAKGYKYHR